MEASYCPTDALKSFAANTGRFTKSEIHVFEDAASVIDYLAKKLGEYIKLGSFDRLCELAEADKDGKCVVLPCMVGDTVYTIDEDYFNCEKCDYKNEASFDPQYRHLSCGFPSERHCPYKISEHIVEGFNVSADKNGCVSLSAPGEWGCEGLEQFSGSSDGKWYLTKEAAEAALEANHAK